MKEKDYLLSKIDEVDKKLVDLLEMIESAELSEDEKENYRQQVTEKAESEREYCRGIAEDFDTEEIFCSIESAVRKL